MKEFLSEKQIELAAETTKKEREIGKKNVPCPAEIANASDAEKQIFDIQKKKQRLINEGLGKQRRMDEKKEIFEEGKPLARYDEQRKMFIVEKKNKESQPVTFGDLITDSSWGLEYNFDKSVPGELQKRYILATTGQKVSGLYNKQLLIEKLTEKELHYQKRRVYKKILGATEREYEHSAGLIFEKILENLLLQIQHDMPDLNVKIERANVVQDVEYKIDFIIKVKSRQRGAKIEEVAPEKVEGPRILGIQFTLISPSDPDYERKLRQCEVAKRHLTEMKIDDLILISLPTDNREIVNKYKTWKELGKPSGGPERLYDTHTKIEILKSVLQKMGIDDILENQEERLKEYYNSKLAQTI